MFVLSKSYLQNFEKRSIELTLKLSFAPKPFCRYVDNWHARFESTNNATEFLYVLNCQDLQIQQIFEYEYDNKELNFLNVATRTNEN